MIQVYIVILKMKKKILTSSILYIYMILLSYGCVGTFISIIQLWYWLHKLFDISRRYKYSIYLHNIQSTILIY